ncbi:hypothetical protein X737_30060 [Mesorhizobium sp. L48C026A00]|nr:hypothetical protein X737_30060 [Mesorhizobium sp. L48C026A00]
MIEHLSIAGLYRLDDVSWPGEPVVDRHLVGCSQHRDDQVVALLAEPELVRVDARPEIQLVIVAIGTGFDDRIGAAARLEMIAVVTCPVAGIGLPVAMLLLIVGDGTYWTVVGFILLYGLGSGALAVSRATIPLVFYDKAEFAKATSRIALPLNLISAASPPTLIGLLTQFGSHALLGLATLCSCGALLILFLLSRRRPSFEATVSQKA